MFGVLGCKSGVEEIDHSQHVFFYNFYNFFFCVYRARLPLLCVFFVCVGGGKHNGNGWAMIKIDAVDSM